MFGWHYSFCVPTPFQTCLSLPSTITIPRRTHARPPQQDKDQKAFMDDAAFQEIETEFNSVLSGLDADPALQSFKTEYEKLYQALSKSHDSEKRLMGKCRELNAELVTAASKVRRLAATTLHRISAVTWSQPAHRFGR